MKNILITGGAGFIGSHVLRLFVNKYTNYNIFNVDNLTYAGNLENISDLDKCKNYNFLYGDICDDKFLNKIFDKYQFKSVIHLAAESHVDNSINNPSIFALTNVIGTVNLLNSFININKKDFRDCKFYSISTDEVYGSLKGTGLFSEKSPYKPNSPYSASKASSDHFVRAYGKTYGMPYIISNSSNNYGPNQYPEKLIPLFINNIINNKKLPVYGNGQNIRDWLYVEDHAKAVDIIFHKGKIGETYNVGGFNEIKNIDLIHSLCDIIDDKLNNPTKKSRNLIKFINDRPGHDLRYAIDASKIIKELGWKPLFSFEKGLSITIDWYLDNIDWLQKIVSGDFEKYYNNQYITKQ